MLGLLLAKDPDESCQRAGQKRRAAAGGGGGSAGRRKTDLASFTAPAKEDGAGATKKTRPRVSLPSADKGHPCILFSEGTALIFHGVVVDLTCRLPPGGMER
jgi:hypothetical protein